MFPADAVEYSGAAMKREEETYDCFLKRSKYNCIADSAAAQTPGFERQASRPGGITQVSGPQLLRSQSGEVVFIHFIAQCRTVERELAESCGSKTYFPSRAAT